MKIYLIIIFVIFLPDLSFGGVDAPDSTAWQQLIQLQDAYIESMENERKDLLQRIEHLLSGQQLMLSGMSDSLKSHQNRLNVLRKELDGARKQLATYQLRKEQAQWVDRLSWGGGGLLAGVLLVLLLN